MCAWDIAIPDGSEAASQGDDRIRELKSDIQNALRGQDATGVEAIFPGSDLASPVYRYRGLKGLGSAQPPAGEYGLYANETKNTLQRDNGAAWVDIATLIPAGTVMVFYQAAAPVGWTQVVTQNDKALRVVSGAGGGSGGALAVSAGLTHSHTVNSHTHPITSQTSGGPSALTVGIQGGGSGQAGGNAHTHTTSGVTDAATPGTDAQSPALAYIDVLLASKD
jgi:hypothetical protein